MNKPVTAHYRGNGVWKIGTECFESIDLVMHLGFPVNQVVASDVLATFLEARPDLRVTAMTFEDEDTLLITTEPRKSRIKKSYPTSYILHINNGNWRFVDFKKATRIRVEKTPELVLK